VGLLLRTVGRDFIEPVDQLGVASAFLDYMLHAVAASAATFTAEYCDLACPSVGYHEKFRYRGTESRYDSMRSALLEGGHLEIQSHQTLRYR
jgi:hypothetical protein